MSPTAHELHDVLTRAGADVVDVPLVQTERLLRGGWETTAHQWTRYSWVCMTSRDAVETLATAVSSAGLPMATVQTAVVGAAAHDAAAERLWSTSVDIPDIAVGVGALTTTVVAAATEEFLRREDVAGRHMLLLTSEELAESLAHSFETLGVTVHTVVVTKTSPMQGLAANLSGLLPTMTGTNHAMLVTSPHAVDLLTEAIPPEKTSRYPMICIGKPTARAARTAGFAVRIEMEYVNGPALVRRMRQLAITS